MTLLVREYDQAIDFYVHAAGFELVEDTDLGHGKRWVRVRPRHTPQHGCELLLARATTDAQRAAIGNQTGGRVMGFLETDDFARDHAAMTARGVRFSETPRAEAYGTVAVFEDCYGNRWDLIEYANDSSTPTS